MRIFRLAWTDSPGPNRRCAGAAALALCLAVPPAARAASSATLTALDVFGTERFTAADVQARFGRELAKLFDARNRQAESARRPAKAARHAAEASAAHKALEDGVRREWDLAWVRVSWNDDWTTDERKVYLVVDVVEKAEAANRMPFVDVPTGTFTDPDGLIEAWGQYQELGLRLAREGTIPVDRAPCPAFYCTWGSRTAELARLEGRFVSLVPRLKEALLAVLRGDRDPARRATVLFLLGYLRDGGELSRVLRDGLRDPDVQVRLAAFQMLSELGIYHKEVSLPIEWVSAALGYPTVEDRSKALAVLLAVANNPAYRGYIIEDSGRRLLRLLRLQVPANHGHAYSALCLLSGERYGDRDYDAWAGWLEAAKAAAAGARPSP